MAAGVSSAVVRKNLDTKKSEINYLYGKIGEIEGVLKEQKKVNQRMRSDVESKIQQIMSVEAQIASEKERFRWKKVTTLGDMEMQQETGDARLGELRRQENDINLEIAEYDILLAENDKLHGRYQAMIGEHAAAIKLQEDEREERKKLSFDTRISMEVILRQTIKAADDEYKLKASEKMGSEALLAGQENLTLKAAKGKWEEMCKNLVHQQQQSYEELVKIRVAKEVISATTAMQEISLAVMDEHIHGLLNDIHSLEDEKSSLEQSIVLVEEEFRHKKELKQQLQLAKAEERHAKAERKAVCHQSLQVSQAVLAVGFAVIERDQRQKSKKLSTGMGGSANLAEEEDKDGVGMEADAKAESGAEEAKETAPLDADDSAGDKAIDHECVWNSRKSDLHLAESLRLSRRRKM